MFNIKKIDKETKKINAIKLRKLVMQALFILKFVYPGLLTMAATYGIFSVGGLKPFVRNTEKKYMYTIEAVDSYNNKDVTNVFTNKDLLDDGFIKYYSNWNKVNDHYEREVKEYEIGKLNNYLVEKIINEPETIKKLEDIFGKPVFIDIEYKDNLTEDEINSNGYLQAKLYSVDKSRYIETELPITSDITQTIIETIFGLLATTAIYLFRSMCGGYTSNDLEWDIKQEKRNCDFKIREFKRSNQN